MFPVKLLVDKSKCSRFVRFMKLSGMVPIKLHFDIHMNFKFFIFPNSNGIAIGLSRKLSAKPRVSRLDKSPISLGMVPLKLF